MTQENGSVMWKLTNVTSIIDKRHLQKLTNETPKIDECHKWNMTNVRGQSKTCLIWHSSEGSAVHEREMHVYFYFRDFTKSTRRMFVMQSFNNVYSSCILIQIEVYQPRKRKLNSEEKASWFNTYCVGLSLKGGATL